MGAEGATEVLSSSTAGNVQAEQCACIDAAALNCQYQLPAEAERYQSADREATRKFWLTYFGAVPFELELGLVSWQLFMINP